MKIECEDNKVFFENKGSKKEIHPFWLRERANGDAYVDKSTRQRLFDPTGLQNNIKINSLNLKSSVSFTGHLPKEQWIELSCNYDIFINTTNYDNTPVTIIEAMALGLPIVSTNVGGMPKLIKHDYNGKLVNANDTLGMIECIRQYVEDEKQLLYICNNARMDVDNNYSKINVVPKWFRLINDII